MQANCEHKWPIDNPNGMPKFCKTCNKEFRAHGYKIPRGMVGGNTRNRYDTRTDGVLYYKLKSGVFSGRESFDETHDTVRK